ncbi:glycosyltransferase [Leifsonia shinshuensis]|uniref:Glycosyltransferase involved in cell wall biosynthesis n=1 Tax=Leifsonia shinshuensis TaxID=150026 RepID=A0A853CRQ5_9MICO|nr:glycosyltransferase involved in cell wall biosynthesis [Leifsonia shinshuensis]
MKVGYGRVWDPSYPRNARIRAYLRDRFGADITVNRRWEGSRLRRIPHDIGSLLFGLGGKRLYVLAEFSLPYAPVLWLVARLNRGVFVVDGFVGQYETMVEDWKKARPGTLRARWYATVDRIACRLADLVLIDTRVRAQALAGAHPGTEVLSLPVGAPAWARPAAERGRRTGRVEVLYYGNYIPLHGLPVVLAAIERAAREVDLGVTLVGDGTPRPDVERQAARLGIAGLCRFVDPVPEEELAHHIRDADVVLGIFGDSEKARSVIANKVWQGLASGKMVITRASPALAEIADVCGAQLSQVDGESEEALVAALAEALVARAARPAAVEGETAAALEAYVASEYDRFGRRVEELLAARRR